VEETIRMRVPMQETGAEWPVVVMIAIVMIAERRGTHALGR
jgi:hypothetical protein